MGQEPESCAHRPAPAPCQAGMLQLRPGDVSPQPGPAHGRGFPATAAALEMQWDHPERRRLDSRLFAEQLDVPLQRGIRPVLLCPPAPPRLGPSWAPPAPGSCPSKRESTPWKSQPHILGAFTTAIAPPSPTSLPRAGCREPPWLQLLQKMPAWAAVGSLRALHPPGCLPWRSVPSSWSPAFLTQVSSHAGSRLFCVMTGSDQLLGTASQQGQGPRPARLVVLNLLHKQGKT